MGSVRPTSFSSALVNDWKVGASTLWQVFFHPGEQKPLSPWLFCITETRALAQSHRARMLALDFGLPIHVIPASHPVFLCFLALLHLCDCVSLARSPHSFGPRWGHRHSLTDLKIQDPSVALAQLSSLLCYEKSDLACLEDIIPRVLSSPG